MRYAIVRTLVGKELMRLQHNRGAIALASLLIVFAVLLSLFDRSGDAAPAFGGVSYCCVDYWEKSPWIDHLKANVPDALKGKIHFRHISTIPVLSDGKIYYPNTAGGIQIRTQPEAIAPGQKGYLVWSWYPGEDRNVLAPYENWFWSETARYFRTQWQSQRGTADSAVDDLGLPLDAHPLDLWPALYARFEKRALNDSPTGSQLPPHLAVKHTVLEGEVFSLKQTVAMALVMFSLFFSCVYLLPSLTCEERERGVLLAQALSPAKLNELLLAKFLTFPLMGLGLAALLAGICKPAVLGSWFFWGVLLSGTWASFGLGMTISCVAQTQRSASMGAMCYTLAVSMFLLVCQQTGLSALSYVFIEFHIPRLLQASLSERVLIFHYGNLAVMMLLAGVWLYVAHRLFRRYGWQ